MTRYNIITIFFLSILGFSLIGLNSCKKDPKIYALSGKVYDPQLESNINGASVVLRASKVQSGVYNSNYVDIASTSTSSNGAYSMEIEEEKVSGYRYYVSKQDYFDELIDIETEDLQQESSYTKNFSLNPIGYIQVNVKNTTPQGTDDEVRYRFKNVEAQCKDCWNNEINVGIGPTYSSNKSAQVIGERDLLIEWVVKKGGQQHIYQDTITSKAFQTVNFSINY